MFSAALSILHHSMRAYSREAFAVGVAHDARPRQFRDTVGMFVNTVLVPFKGGTDGGCETVQDLHRRWTNDILQHATAPYDMVSSIGYGCNVYLAFNVGILGTDDDAGTSRTNGGAEDKNSMDSNMPYRSLASDDEFLSEHNTTTSAKFDLSVSWSEAVRTSNSPGDELTVSFE